MWAARGTWPSRCWAKICLRSSTSASANRRASALRRISPPSISAKRISCSVSAMGSSSSDSMRSSRARAPSSASPSLGPLGKGLHHAGQGVGRDMVQRQAKARAGEVAVPRRRRLRPLGHAGVDVVDHRPEKRVEPVARLRQIDLDLGDHPARIGGEDEDTVAHQHRLLDVVGDEQDRADRHASLRPQVEQVGAQGLGGQHVEGREGLVHQEDRRLDHQGAGEADALAHAAGELLGIGVFKAVEADQVDRRQCPPAPLLGGNAARLEAQFDILLHRQPGEEGEALEHHGDAVGGLLVGHVAHLHGPGGRGDQAGDRAQQGRLARAGAAEQAGDLAGAQGQLDIVEHQQSRASLAVDMLQVAHLDQRRANIGGTFQGHGHGQLLLGPRVSSAARGFRSRRRGAATGCG